MTKLKKLLVATLSAAMIAGIGVAGVNVAAGFPDGNQVSAIAEETERKDVKITKIDGEGNTNFTPHFDLVGRTGNGTNVNNAAEVGDYIYYNGKSCKNAFFDIHMRSAMFYFYPKAGTTLKEGDRITFRKGLHFPVVTTDTEAVTKYQDYLGETVVYTYSGTGSTWINQTEENKKTEQKVNVTGLGGGAGNGETLKTDIKFLDSGNDHNYTSVEDWAEVSGYIYYNGEILKNQFDVHMMSGNFYVYPNSGFSFSDGDTISIVEGLHMPSNPEPHYGGPTPSYEIQKYTGYIAETYTIEYTKQSGWIKQATVGEPNELDKIGEVKEVVAGATMPATYEFTMNFALRVSRDELTELEKDDNYAKNIYIEGKSVYDWNATTPAEDNDGETIPAISVSAYGTGITIRVVKSVNIVKAGENFSVKVGKEFVCTSGNTIEEDITRYYIDGLAYWSTIAPYEIEKTHTITIKKVNAFEVIDNGANGAILIYFNEKLADKQLLSYNCHPDYLKTLPAAYPVDKADDFASSGSTLSFINNVYINGKSMADYWAECSSTEQKSSLYQCHIMEPTVLRVGSSVSNGFDGNLPIEIVFKSGLTFFNGAYLDHDITVKYTPAAGETPASTTYSVDAKTIELTADVTALKVNETAQLTAAVVPADYSGNLVYVSSDETIATVSADGKVTALKAGTVKITAKVGEIVSQEVTFTVTNPSATKIELSSDKTSLKVGEIAQLTAEVTPDPYEGTLVYVSSDETIATVAADGKVTALKAGTVKITAKIGELASQEVTLTITKPAATEIKLSSDKTSLKVGETAQLTAEVKPEGYEGTLVYVSSDETIATVAADGKVTALKAGKVEITAKIGDLVSNKVTIEITEKQPPVTSSDETSTGGKTSSDASKGCGSVVSAGLIGAVGLLGVAIVLKKKKD